MSLGSYTNTDNYGVDCQELITMHNMMSYFNGVIESLRQLVNSV